MCKFKNVNIDSSRTETVPVGAPLPRHRNRRIWGTKIIQKRVASLSRSELEGDLQYASTICTSFCVIFLVDT